MAVSGDPSVFGVAIEQGLGLGALPYIVIGVGIALLSIGLDRRGAVALQAAE
jgi:hypothetical protein